MATVKRVKRKKLNVKALLMLLLMVYLIVMLFYTVFTLPIKNIYIKNTSLLSDNEVIEIAGIKIYPSIFKVNSKGLEKKIRELELVEDVKVKKTFKGELIIEIDEAEPLFYNRKTERVVLSNGREVEASNKYLGIPTLINSVPSDMLKNFVKAFKNVDADIIKMINEILYDPDIKDNVTIDDSRFLLRMNDTNILYVNVLNMKRLNNYKSFLMLVGDQRGTLLLDSYDSSNSLLGLFTPFEEQSTDGGDDLGGQDKLPE